MPGARSAPMLVGLGRLERPTSPLSGVRSNHLSYRPGMRGSAPGADAPVDPLSMRRKRSAGGRSVPQYGRHRQADAPLIFQAEVQGFPLRGEQRPMDVVLRKEVIQPQVPLRLPCYDFTPVADPTVVACPLAVGAAPSGRTNSHGVTGGVYKARERIHRGMLIHDY